jgi:hypothetical protein
MGRNDVPQEHLLLEIELGKDSVHDRRRGLRRPLAGELSL